MSEIRWVPYKDGSAVQEMNKAKALVAAQGIKLADASQGAIDTEPPEAYFPREVTIRLSRGYPKHAGGTPEQRKVFAEFENEFLGYGFATAQNTFFLPQHGRSGLHEMFNIGSAPYVDRLFRPAMAAGHLAWPMVASIARQAHMKTHFSYQLRTGGFGEELAATIAAHNLDSQDMPEAGDTLLAMVYSNYRNNPLSLHGTTQEVVQAQGLINGINDWRRSAGLPVVLHAADNPYFMGRLARAAVQDGMQGPGAYRMACAYADAFQPNTGNPVIINTSLAKAVAWATPGGHLKSFTEDDMAAQYEEDCKARSGFSYPPELMELAAQYLGKKNWPHLSAHFTALANIFGRNFDIVKQSRLGPLMLDGDEGMVITIRIPEEAMNKIVSGIDVGDGQPFISSSGRKVAEYALNKHHAAAVDQSIVLQDGEHVPLVRIALKDENPDVIRNVVQGYENTIDELSAAPPAPAL